MAQVLIRDLPDEVVERLKEKARLHGRSLEAHLRVVLEEASRSGREDFTAFANAMRDKYADRPQSDSAELIRAFCDRNWSPPA